MPDLEGDIPPAWLPCFFYPTGPAPLMRRRATTRTSPTALRLRPLGGRAGPHCQGAELRTEHELVSAWSLLVPKPRARSAR